MYRDYWYNLRQKGVLIVAKCNVNVIEKFLKDRTKVCINSSKV